MNHDVFVWCSVQMYTTFGRYTFIVTPALDIEMIITRNY